MKRFILCLALAASPLVHAQVGVSVNLGEPGFFGQINIGNMPPPPVVYSSPMIVEQPEGGMAYPPMYLRVPPEHHRDWRHYCHEYNACNRQVYFVTDDWYHNTYVPRYAEEHGHGHGHGHDDERGPDHEHDHGHDHGHGHDDER